MVSPSLSDGLIDNHFGVTCSYLFLVTLFSTLSPTIINVHPSQHLNITTTMITTTKQTIQFTTQALSIAIALGFLLFFFFKRINKKPSRNPSNPALPVVPGLPLVGNLLQLKDKKPHQTFARWAETYGPIYSIKTGATTLVVINTADVAREAMVTRFSSISTRKLSNAIKILSFDKTMVSLSDYGDFHKMAKRNIITGLLGGNAQDYLYREIESVCGSNKISEDRMSQIPYLSVVFHETLRRYSPAPMVPLRYVHEDTELGGYHIPAGSEISINIYGCNMNKKQWEEPEKWKPERFLDGKCDPTDMYKTMAFGAGKRVCAGSQQAMTISCLAIGAFVQEFEWRLSEGQKAEFNTLGLTSYKLDALLAFITPRKG